MKKTPLKQKTPLKAKTPLKRTPLKRTSNKKSTACSSLTKNKSIKKKRTTSGPYKSIFTEDLKKCMFTGKIFNIHVHHIFFGCSSNKISSEKYGFMIPLEIYWHTGSKLCVHQNYNLNLALKWTCQEYWLNVLKKTKEEWLNEFTEWWDEPDWSNIPNVMFFAPRNKAI